MDGVLEDYECTINYHSEKAKLNNGRLKLKGSTSRVNEKRMETVRGC